MTSTWTLAPQSDIPPKSKSDHQWIRDMGFRDMREFEVHGGFDRAEADGARLWLRICRNKQQEEWEDLRSGKATPSTSAHGEKSTTTKLRRRENDVNLRSLPHQHHSKLRSKPRSKPRSSSGRLDSKAALLSQRCDRLGPTQQHLRRR